jgi:hypothetical protein
MLPPNGTLHTLSLHPLSPLHRGWRQRELTWSHLLFAQRASPDKDRWPQALASKGTSKWRSLSATYEDHSFIFSSRRNPLIWMQGLACSLIAYEEDAERFMVESHLGLSKKKASRIARKPTRLGMERPKEEVITDVSMLTET